MTSTNDTFMNNFNSVSENKYSYLRVGSVDYTENKEKQELNVCITFIVPYEIYNDSTKFNHEIQADIENITKNILPENVNLKVKYSKLQISDQVVKRLVNEYIKDHFARLLNDKYLANEIEVEIKTNNVDITIPIESAMKYYADLKIKPYLEEFLNLQYNAINSIKFKPIEIKQDETFKVNQTNKIVDDGIIDISQYGKVLLGQLFPDPPLYISKYIKASKDATICGKIIQMDKRLAKSGKLYYVLLIQDVKESIMKCMYFAKRSGTAKSKIEALKVGDQVIVNGDLMEDNFAGKQKFTMFINNLRYCIVDEEKTKQKIEYFKRLVKKTQVPEPKPYAEEMEETPITLFDEIPYICPLLRDGTFTVFDLETTGLIDNGVIPNIVEIAGVRIENGEIVSEFSTLVDPEMHIPEAATNTNHITDDMVEDAPLIKDVIGPFLKFAHNTILVGHNIARFDIPIVEHFAKECGYRFDFKILDTLQMAQQSGIELKSYSLASCINHFNLQNENAHRALSDTIANAKLFMKLANYMKLDSLQ